MACGTLKTAIKNSVFAFFIAGIGIGNMGAEVMNTTSAQLVPKQSKYLNNGTLEQITFYAQHGPDSQKKIARNGILVKRPYAKGVIILCHGYMCDKFDTGFIRTIFPKFHIINFDFRAHGEGVDEQQCCTFGRDEEYDVLAAVDYIKSRKDLQAMPRIAYGFSMGAVAAIQAQAHDSTLFNLMVLDCSYDHSENVIKRGLQKMKFSLFGYEFNIPGRGLLEKYAFNSYVQSLLKTVLKTVAHMDATATNTYIYPVSPADSIKKVSIPCFFIHCVNDEKIHVAGAKRLFNNAASGYKRLWLTDGRRHFDSFFYNPEKYIYKVNTFINAVLDGSYKSKKSEKILKDM